MTPIEHDSMGCHYSSVPHSLRNDLTSDNTTFLASRLGQQLGTSLLVRSLVRTIQSVIILISNTNSAPFVNATYCEMSNRCPQPRRAPSVPRAAHGSVPSLNMANPRPNDSVVTLLVGNQYLSRLNISCRRLCYCTSSYRSSRFAVLPDCDVCSPCSNTFSSSSGMA